ncbi:MAG: flagellar hook-length control protein FliK [Vicinamibacterales bacterium]
MRAQVFPPGPAPAPSATARRKPDAPGARFADLLDAAPGPQARAAGGAPSAAGILLGPRPRPAHTGMTAAGAGSRPGRPSSPGTAPSRTPAATDVRSRERARQAGSARHDGASRPSAAPDSRPAREYDTAGAVAGGPGGKADDAADEGAARTSQVARSGLDAGVGAAAAAPTETGHTDAANGAAYAAGEAEGSGVATGAAGEALQSERSAQSGDAGPDADGRRAGQQHGRAVWAHGVGDEAGGDTPGPGTPAGSAGLAGAVETDGTLRGTGSLGTGTALAGAGEAGTGAAGDGTAGAAAGGADPAVTPEASGAVDRAGDATDARAAIAGSAESGRAGRRYDVPRGTDDNAPSSDAHAWRTPSARASAAAERSTENPGLATDGTDSSNLPEWAQGALDTGGGSEPDLAGADTPFGQEASGAGAGPGAGHAAGSVASGDEGGPADAAASVGGGRTGTPGVVAPALTPPGLAGTSLVVPATGHVPAGAPPDAGNLDRLVQSMRLQARDGIAEATIRLRPDHFGDVTISVRVERGVVTASVLSDSADVKAWLREHEASLRAGLAEQGLELGDLVISDEDRPRERHDAPRQPRRSWTTTPDPDAPRFDVVV